MSVTDTTCLTVMYDLAWPPCLLPACASQEAKHFSLSLFHLVQRLLTKHHLARQHDGCERALRRVVAHLRRGVRAARGTVRTRRRHAGREGARGRKNGRENGQQQGAHLGQVARSKKQRIIQRKKKKKSSTAVELDPLCRGAGKKRT